MGSQGTTTAMATLRERHVQAKRDATVAQIERIGWSADRLAAERTRRLQAMLRLATERSAWHRERLADVDPACVSEHDIRELPVMTKDDVMSQFDRIVTDPRVTLTAVESHLASLTDGPRHLLDRYEAIASGGSTGVRGVFVYDWDAWVTCYLGWFRYLGHPGFPWVTVLAGYPQTHIREHSERENALGYATVGGDSFRFSGVGRRI
jgi:phenylacetate-CoA ligase